MNCTNTWELCDREVKSRGMCMKHYQRWHCENSDPCTADGCSNSQRCRTLCQMHYVRAKKSGIIDDFPKGKSGYVKNKKVTYGGIHQRLVSLYGPARLHRCRNCSSMAKDWAYMGGDPNESKDFIKGSLLSWGSEPKFYIPLCKKCHHEYDNKPRDEFGRFIWISIPPSDTIGPMTQESV